MSPLSREHANRVGRWVLLVVVAMLATNCVAQSRVELVNPTDKTVQGWFQTNIDFTPPFPSGSTPRGNYVVGQRSGLDTWNVDVYTGIGPGERLVLDLAQATNAPFTLPPPPTNNFLGGVPVKIAGVRMAQVSADANGAAHDFHFFARVGPMLAVHLWLHSYPDSPAWCPGEVLVVASNPSVKDVAGTIPANFRLQIGEANVYVPGLPPNPDLMAAGDWLASGQSRALPLTALWNEHCTETDFHTAAAWLHLQVNLRGIQKLHRDGNPLLPDGFDSAAWANGLLPTAIERQHDWLNGPLSPAPESGWSGAQGPAQFFCGGPAMADPSAVSVLYIGALDSSWPMLHLEADGRVLDWRGHTSPPLRMFYGQPNWRLASETGGDMLGKERGPNLGESHGYAGWEDEHAFFFTRWAGARLKGTPALQMQLEAWAAHFLFRYVTVPPGNWLSAPRAMGWMGMFVAELHQGLRDRDLAEAVAQRFREVCDQLVIPTMLPNDAWWGWTDDPRLGGQPGDWRTVPWQPEVMCVGMDLAGEATNHRPARDMALHMAREILRLAWVKVDGRWTSRTVIARDGRVLADIPLGYYDSFGMKAVDVVLRHEPGNQQAGEIWRQRRREATTYEACGWFVPGVEPTP